MAQRHERRIAQRVPTALPVHYIHDGEYVKSRCRDISIDGMYLCTDEPPAVNMTTVVNFFLDDVGEVEAEAEVVWVDRRSGGMAVRFIDLPVAARKSILGFVTTAAHA